MLRCYVRSCSGNLGVEGIYIYIYIGSKKTPQNITTVECMDESMGELRIHKLLGKAHGLFQQVNIPTSRQVTGQSRSKPWSFRGCSLGVQGSDKNSHRFERTVGRQEMLEVFRCFLTEVFTRCRPTPKGGRTVTGPMRFSTSCRGLVNQQCDCTPTLMRVWFTNNDC